MLELYHIKNIPTIGYSLLLKLYTSTGIYIYIYIYSNCVQSNLISLYHNCS